MVPMRGWRQRQEMAAAKAAVKAQREAAGKPPRQPPLTRLAPGQHLETRFVLAGAYRGKDISERELLSHAVLVEGVRPGYDVRTLCRQPVDSIADTYSSPDMLYEAPTCPTCLPRWERLQERYLEDMHAEPDMERNGNIPTAEEDQRLDDLIAYCSALLDRLHGDELDAALEGEAKRRGQSDAEFRKRTLNSVHPDDLASALAHRGINLARFGISEIRRQHEPNARRRTTPLLDGDADTGRVRGTSGRFQKGTACDFCGKSCRYGSHMSDTRVCGEGGDGPGFLLCDSPACEQRRDKVEREEGLEGLARRYAEGRAINESKEARSEARMAPKGPFRPSYDMFSRAGALQHAGSHGHQMGPWDGDVATCERCGQTIVWQDGGPLGDAWQRGSRCEMRSNARKVVVVIGRRIYGEGPWVGVSRARDKRDAEDIKRRQAISWGELKALTVFDYEVDRYFKQMEPNSERRYYVWVILSDDTPKDEGPYGPYEFIQAKDFARIAATEGEHDRAVSIGRDPESPSFYIARRYRRGTGERIQ